MTEWFEQWFGEEYLRLYPHRDEADAAAAVALIDRVVPLAGRRVLDLGCGPGRHAERLAARGATVIGLDLSLALLRRARAAGAGGIRLVRGDMRDLPFARPSFDVVVNLFTSFGYFDEDAQHQAALCDAVATLRPAGHFVLDYFNAPWVIDTLISREERVVGADRVVIERRVSPDRRYVTKDMHLVDDERHFVERVRLFGPEELERLFVAAGLAVTRRYGAYDGRAPGPAAPRIILIGTRP